MNKNRKHRPYRVQQRGFKKKIEVTVAKETVPVKRPEMPLKTIVATSPQLRLNF